MKKGGNKKGFLKAKNRLTDAAMDKIKEAWKNLYSNNGENVNAAVASYLSGPDKMGTRLWWDCNPAVVIK